LVTGSVEELDAGSIVDLLDELHTRLLDRRARVSLYVVGGSALLLAHGRDLATPDVDIARSVAAADEAAREIAIERGLAMSWLNSAAAPWVPPSPECTQIPPSHDGLTVHLAPPRHLLAMKLVAWRPKDEDDLVDLLEVCELTDASAEDVADILYGSTRSRTRCRGCSQCLAPTQRRPVAKLWPEPGPLSTCSEARTWKSRIMRSLARPRRGGL
jgi:hypothetical protein